MPKQLPIHYGYSADTKQKKFTPKTAAGYIKKEMGRLNKLRKAVGLKPKTDYSKMIKKIR